MDTDKDDPDIAVEVLNKFKTVKFDSRKLKKLVRTVCSRFEISRVTVSIAVIGNEEIRQLNKKFFGRNRTTDVISFNLSDDNAPQSCKPPTRLKSNSLCTFDIAVNAEQAVTEAKSRSHSAEAELALYVVHGLLHNLGFDDNTRDKAKKMHDIEDEILQQASFGTVYNSVKGKQ